MSVRLCTLAAVVLTCGCDGRPQPSEVMESPGTPPLVAVVPAELESLLGPVFAAWEKGSGRECLRRLSRRRRRARPGWRCRSPGARRCRGRDPRSGRRSPAAAARNDRRRPGARTAARPRRSVACPDLATGRHRLRRPRPRRECAGRLRRARGREAQRANLSPVVRLAGRRRTACRTDPPTRRTAGRTNRTRLAGEPGQSGFLVGGRAARGDRRRALRSRHAGPASGRRRRHWDGPIPHARNARRHADRSRHRASRESPGSRRRTPRMAGGDCAIAGRCARCRGPACRPPMLP